MAVPRMLALTKCVKTPLTFQDRSISLPFLGVYPVSTWLQQRDYSVNSNMTLMSADQGSQPADTRKLVVMFPWLLAKGKQVIKYANFYMGQGFDVLTVSITPWQMLWPVKGCQPVMEDLLKFLRDCRYHKLILHSFSVSVYLWGEALVKINQDMERLVGQVWDSAADVSDITAGFPHAVFPASSVLQSALRSYISYHLRVFHKSSTQHYVCASQMFYTGTLRAPALFLISKIDPIGSERNSRVCSEAWEALGIDTRIKCWDDSPHIGHFRKYPKEYLAELSKFLGRLGLIPTHTKQLRAKL